MQEGDVGTKSLYEVYPSIRPLSECRDPEVLQETCSEEDQQ